MTTTEKTINSTQAPTGACQFRGFTKGLDQILHKDWPDITAKLREALGINNRVSLWAYKNGKLRLRAEQAVKIQQIFNDYGVTEIWDA